METLTLKSEDFKKKIEELSQQIAREATAANAEKVKRNSFLGAREMASNILSSIRTQLQQINKTINTGLDEFVASTGITPMSGGKRRLNKTIKYNKKSKTRKNKRSNSTIKQKSKPKSKLNTKSKLKPKNCRIFKKITKKRIIPK